MSPVKPNLRWPTKIAISAALCLAGALAGTGLYAANLSYVSAADHAARMAAAAAAADALQPQIAASQITVPGSDGYGDQGANDVTYNPNGETIATADLDGTVRFWNTTTHHQTGPTITIPGSNSNGYLGAYEVAYSPDGKTLATADVDGTVRLWNTTGHQTGPTITIPSNNNGSLGNNNGSLGAYEVAYSPDGKTLATADVDGTVDFWNPVTGRPVSGTYRR